MAFLEDSDRFQIKTGSFEEAIEKDNPARFIDVFVDHLLATSVLAKIRFPVPLISWDG
jgi:hypothetical protein